MVRRAALGLALACLVFACADPEIIEDTATSCSNGQDDDGDDLIDCQDPSCGASGKCEGTMAACANGVDDDNDQATDCEDTACIEVGSCDAIETACEPLPQSGCPVGMGCYGKVTGGVSTGTSCRLAGTGRESDPCDSDKIGTLGVRDPHPCAAGNGCVVAGTKNGVCGRYCRSDTDCGAFSVCLAAGACSSPCDPRSNTGCSRPAYTCLSRHEVGNAYAMGGARWACYDVALARNGQALAGASCDDPPSASSPTSRICKSDLACVLGGSGAVCRPLCTVGGSPCATGTCTALYPGQKPSGFNGMTFGVCL